MRTPQRVLSMVSNSSGGTGANIPEECKPMTYRRRTRMRRGFVAAAVVASLVLVVGQAMASHDTGPYMFFAKFDKTDNTANDKHVMISGNSNIYQGKIKSNGDIDHSGNCNKFEDTVRYYDMYNDGGNNNDFIPNDPDACQGDDVGDTEPQQQAFDANYPGNLETWTSPTCDYNFTDDKAFDPDTDPNGVYCGDGDTDFTVPSDAGWPDCGDFTAPPWPQPCGTPKQWTLITGGKIDISGENVHIVPAAGGHGVLGYSSFNDPAAISWSGNEGYGEGLFFAPNGTVKVHGNESVWCMQVVGEMLDIQGNENLWGAPCGGVEPTPTPSPTPSPSPSPTPSP